MQVATASENTSGSAARRASSVGRYSVILSIPRQGHGEGNSSSSATGEQWAASFARSISGFAGRSAAQSFETVPSSATNLVLLYELPARGWGREPSVPTPE